MRKLLSVIVGCVLAAPLCFGQNENDISIPEFRQSLYDFITMVDARQGTNFTAQFQMIPDSALIKWYTGVPNPRLFKEAVAGIKARTQAGALPPRSRPNGQAMASRPRTGPGTESRFALSSSFSPAGISSVVPPDYNLFDPEYPSGTGWETMVSYIKTQDPGLLPAGPASNSAATGCDGNLESYYSVLVSTFQGVKDAAESACEIVPNILVVILGEGTEVPAKEVCFAVTLILNVFNSEASSIAASCNTQDGLVMGANIEASYFNTVALNNLKLRLKIEQNLGNTAAPMGIFELPTGMGGYLEIARAITSDTINRMIAAGLSMSSALAQLNQGDTYFNAKSYKLAYKTYQKAYALAVQ